MKTPKYKGKQSIWKYHFNGSSTIEASLLMPMILTVLFLVIYLTLFLYGKAQLTRNAYVSVLRASQAETETIQKRAAIAKQEFEILQNKSFLSGMDVAKKIQIKGDEIIIYVDYCQKTDRVIFLEKGLRRKAFAGSMEYKAKTNHPASFIWKCRLTEAISQNADHKEEQNKVKREQDMKSKKEIE